MYDDDPNLKAHCEKQYAIEGDTTTYITRQGVFRTSVYKSKIPYENTSI